jgi:hypothetical protein
MNKLILTLSLLISFNHTFGQKYEVEVAPESVYNANTIVWFGADFSFFKLTDEKKVGKDDELKVYIDAWNYEYKYGLPNVKLATLLKKEKVINDHEFTDEIAENFSNNQWIVKEENRLDPEEIQSHLLDIESENTGLGLIYIVVNFNKNLPGVMGYFVWFDIKSKKIKFIYESKGTPSTDHFMNDGMKIYLGNKQKNRLPKSQGMTGYWYRGMIDATVDFSIEYKKGMEEDERRY